MNSLREDLLRQIVDLVPDGLPHVEFIHSKFFGLKESTKLDFRYYSDSIPMIEFAWDLIGDRKNIKFQDTLFQYLSDVDILKHYCDQGYYQEACSSAAIYGHLEILQYAKQHSKEQPWSYHTCNNAAGNGHLEILKYASTVIPLDQRVYDVAVRYGQIEIIDYLHSLRYRPTESTLLEATFAGNLEIIKYVFDSDSMDTILFFLKDSDIYDICDVAAEYGHFEVMKYLHDCGFPLTRKTLRSVLIGAAKKLHSEEQYLEIIKYLHTNHNYPLKSKLYQIAKKKNLSTVLAYLIENNCPVDDNLDKYPYEDEDYFDSDDLYSTGESDYYSSDDDDD